MITRRPVVGAGIVVALSMAGCAADGEAGPTPTRPDATTTTAPVFTRSTAATASVAPTSEPISTAAATTTTDTTTSTTSTSTTTSTTSTTSTTTTVPPPVGPVVCPPTGSSIWEVRPPSELPAPPLPDGWTTDVVGTSVQGRDVVALVRPVESPTGRALVIGGLHGNEPVSPPTVRSLTTVDAPPGIEVWLVPEANPDGVAAGMRCNANGVDLNRNFSWGWRPDDGGPAPLSEPETQTLTDLVEQLQPDLVVWVHQPYGYASSIGPTDAAFEQAWAEASGVRVRPDVTQHGGGESWTAFVAERPSMLIEIDSWSATEEMVAAHRDGYAAVLDLLA